MDQTTLTTTQSGAQAFTRFCLARRAANLAFLAWCSVGFQHPFLRLTPDPDLVADEIAASAAVLRQLSRLALAGDLNAADQAVSIPRAERPCRLLEWKPWPFPNPSLIGHATISFGGWEVHRCPVFRRADGSLSVGAPDAPEVDSEGRARLKPDGKRQYWKVITFENNAAPAWRA